MKELSVPSTGNTGQVGDLRLFTGAQHTLETAVDFTGAQHTLESAVGFFNVDYLK